MLKRVISLLHSGLLLALVPILAGARSVYPGGENVGIDLRTNGLIITGTYDVRHASGVYNPQTSDIKRGDKIVRANEQPVTSVVSFTDILKAWTQPQIKLQLVRQSSEITRSLSLYQNPGSNTWRTGLFVKEKILGIGTISYYDPEHNTYGALGHQINDQDTGKIFDVSYGMIYDSQVVGVKAGTSGTPGEKIAQIDSQTILGDVAKNNEYGIYGHYHQPVNKQLMEVAEINQIKTGEAEIWTVLNQHEIDKFKITITALKNQKTADIKGITFRVTDDRLLAKTNGIIQGMSGSPIIQNGRIIGAVTHVLVDKPANGYGVYLIHMLSQSDSI